MPRQQSLPAKCITDQTNTEMAAAVACAGMADMPVAFVEHFKLLRYQGGFESCADRSKTIPRNIAARDARAHGNTRLNGRTLTAR